MGLHKVNRIELITKRMLHYKRVLWREIMKQKNIFWAFIGIILLFLSCSIISVKDTNTLDSIISQLDEKFNKSVEKKIPGAVIVFIKDGEIYYRHSFGYKDKENKIVMTENSIFQVASISKPFCAFAVMKLYEEGLIVLDESINNYLTRWKIPESKYQIQDVTVRRLLSHTAGTSVHGYAGYPPDIGLPTIEQSLLGNPESIYRKYHKSPVILEKKPGEKWNYSGGGYTILQLAVEEITGKSFPEYMNENILKKLNMTDSSFLYNPEMIKRLPLPYSFSLSPIPNFLFSEKAAAGLYTTAEDMANMIIELLKCYHGEDNNFIITMDSLKMMLEPEAKIRGIMAALLGKDARMGLGLFTFDLGNGIKTYGHGGGNQGWTSYFEFCPETRDGMILLTNGNVADFKIVQPLKKAWNKYIRSQ